MCVTIRRQKRVEKREYNIIIVNYYCRHCINCYCCIRVGGKSGLNEPMTATWDKDESEATSSYIHLLRTVFIIIVIIIVVGRAPRCDGGRGEEQRRNGHIKFNGYVRGGSHITVVVSRGGRPKQTIKTTGSPHTVCRPPGDTATSVGRRNGRGAQCVAIRVRTDGTRVQWGRVSSSDNDVVIFFKNIENGSGGRGKTITKMPEVGIDGL